MKKLRRLGLVLLFALFAFVVVGCSCNPTEEDPTKGYLEDAQGRIVFLGDANNLKQDEQLQDTVVVKDTDGNDVTVKVTWSISKGAEYLEVEKTNEGKTMLRVTRPTGNEQGEATLVATLTIEGKEGSKTREFTIYIAPAPSVLTVAELFDAQLNQDVEGEGVVIHAWADKSNSICAYFKDDTGTFFVYMAKSEHPDKVKPGARIRVSGERKAYNNCQQIGGDSATITVLEEAPAEGYNYGDLGVAKTAAEIEALGDGIKLPGTLVKVTGKAIQKTEGDYTNSYLLDELSGKELAIYYGGHPQGIEDFNAKIDKYVELDAVLYAYSDGWRISVIPGTVVEVAAPELTDEEKVAGAVTNLNNQFPENMLVLKDLVLPVTSDLDEALTISWASDHPEVIAVDGKLTKPAEETTVVLTATVTLREVSQEVSLTVKVPVYELSTIAEAHAAAKDDMLYIQGTVIGVLKDGIVVEDATGAILIYDKNGIAAGYGDVVDVIGKKDDYKGLPQLASPTVIVVTEGTGYDHAAKAVEKSVADLCAIEASDLSNIGKVYKVSGKYVTAGSYNNSYIAALDDETTTTDNKVYIYYNNTAEALAQLEGKVGREIASALVVVMGPHDSEKWRYVLVPDSVVWVGLTDEQALAEAKARVEDAYPNNKEVVSNLTFSATVDVEGKEVALAWETDKPEVISNEGVYTAPEADTEVALTVTLTLGELQETYTATLVAKAPIAMTVIKAIDFGTSPTTDEGYGSSSFTFTNADGETMTLQKQRAQLNNSTYAPHEESGCMLVLATKKSAQEAWVEFDFTSYTEATGVKFKIAAWNQSKYDKIMGLVDSVLKIQVKDGDNWVDITLTGEENPNFLSKLEKDKYVEITSNFNPGLYRFYYHTPNATVDNSNTEYAIVVDDVTLFK